MLRAAIFDLDGTLIDTEILWVDATFAYLQSQCAAVHYDDILRIVYGHSWQHIYAEIVDRYDMGHVSMHAMDAVLLGMVKEKRAGRQDLILEGSLGLLRRMAQDIPVCIVSGSPRKAIGEAIALMQIESELAFYIGAEEYAIGKPDPTCFRMAIDRLGVKGEDIVVFEDSHAGVLAAKAAGAYCVALVRAGRPRQDVSAADLVLSDLGDFAWPVKEAVPG